MRRIVLLSLFALLVSDASAQHRGGTGHGFGRGGFGFNRGPSVFSYGFGYGSSPYYVDTPYGYSPQPIIIAQQPPPPVVVQPPPREVRPVVIDYKQPDPSPSTSSGGEPQTFGIVLKDGSIRSATAIVASDDVLHYVDPEDRHLRISMNEVDREATLKLNRERKLTLWLPATP